jgi:hypothetical protein
MRKRIPSSRRNERSGVFRDVALELERLVDLHVARLEGAVGRSTESLLDVGLVEVRLDVLHLFVAEGTVLAVAVALETDLQVKVETGQRLPERRKRGGKEGG